MTREELIKKIMLIKGANQNNMFGYLKEYEAGYIADFIIEDRKRSFIGLINSHDQLLNALRYLAYERTPIGEKLIDTCTESCQERVIQAISNGETLKNAGVQ